jgi:transposase InsO family protein
MKSSAGWSWAGSATPFNASPWRGPATRRPRITAELRRPGWTGEPEAGVRILREDHLLYVRKRKFVVATDSHHGQKVYPNLASQMVVTEVDQLSVADITYIRLQHDFVFLAVILDAWLGPAPPGRLLCVPVNTSWLCT